MLNHLEIVSHVFDNNSDPMTAHSYSTMARWQYASLARHTPEDMQVTWRVFTDEATAPWIEQLERHAQGVANVRVQIDVQDHAQLFRRAIGRNLAALGTTADFVWFTDCDHLFGLGCLESLRVAVADTKKGFANKRRGDLRAASEVMAEEIERFVTPEIVKVSHSNESGYDMIIREWETPLPEIDDEEFRAKKQRITIGGVQIASQALCHRVGYLNDTRWTKPKTDTSGGMREFKDDRAYRNEVGPAEPLDIVNCYRIRHCYEDGHGGPAA